MNSIFNPSMVKLARDKRGMSQMELAKRLGVSNGVVSKIEAGLYSVSASMVDKLVDTLRYPRAFFYQSGRVNPLGVHFYRKAKGISQKELGKINAEINIDSLRLPGLLASGTELPKYNIPYCPLEDEKFKSPELVARALRAYWKLPPGPIPNLVSVLEENGLLIIDCHFPTRFFDADSVTLSDGRSVIFDNANQPSDRMRFTRAHDLGHIVMHRLPHDLVEEEANKFAAEFLMPEADIKFDLRNLSIEKLASLKRKWKVSMQALLKRATTLKVLGPNQADYLWRMISKMGWKLQEPHSLEPPEEKPTLFHALINTHLTELGYSKDDLKRSLFLSLTDDDDEKYFVGAHATPPLRVLKIHRLDARQKE